MMTNHSKPAGSVPTTWELHSYDVWGNSRDGYEVNDAFDMGSFDLRIPQTRYNIGVEWHVCRNVDCPGNHGRVFHTVVANHDIAGAWCPDCGDTVTLESQEFLSAYPTNRQIKLAFGVTCQVETEGDDMRIEVTRKRDGYPLGNMVCMSHESLSPVRKATAKVLFQGQEVRTV